MNNEEKIKELESGIADLERELESKIDNLERDVAQNYVELGAIRTYLKKNDPKAFNDTGSFKKEALE